MDEDESLKPTNVSLDAPQSNPRTNPYNLLMRQSKKMGQVATRTYDVTKEFLKKDVTPFRPANPDRLLFGRKASGAEAKRSDEQAHEEKKQKERVEIKEIVRKSHEVLAVAKTVVLPTNLFPDTVTVDRTKVTINKRTFFWSSQVISMRVEDILNVSCSVGPIFGSLAISSRVMNSTDHFEINYFFRKDAIYLKQLIQGYYIAQHNEIETKDLPRNELISTLLELGSDSGF